MSNLLDPEESYLEKCRLGLSIEDSSSEEEEEVGASPSSDIDLANTSRELFIKILVLGDLGVGKTSLLKTYISLDSSKGQDALVHAKEDAGGMDYKVSVDVGFHLKRLNLGGKRRATLQLWDIPGHERYGGMTRVYYKYAHGALIVFDLSRLETFEAALEWLSDIMDKLFDEKKELIADRCTGRSQEAGGPMQNPSMPVVLLANKCDLPSLTVSRNKYSSYVSENGLLAWFETTSKDATSLATPLKTLTEHILKMDPTFSNA